MRSRRRRTWLLLAVLAAMVNLPLVGVWWEDRQLDRDGIEVSAVVVPTDDPPNVLRLRVPADVGWPDDTRLLSVDVDDATYDRAVADGELPVTVLEDKPGAYRLEGEEISHTALVVGTVLIDLVLVGMALLARRYGGSAPEPLRIAALGDVERCPPGVVFEELGDGVVLARGEVVGLEDGEVVLDVGDREVVVVLDGHANPVGWQQPAQVRGRIVE